MSLAKKKTGPPWALSRKWTRIKKRMTHKYRRYLDKKACQQGKEENDNLRT